MEEEEEGVTTLRALEEEDEVLSLKYELERENNGGSSLGCLPSWSNMTLYSFSNPRSGLGLFSPNSKEGPPWKMFKNKWFEFKLEHGNLNL